MNESRSVLGRQHAVPASRRRFADDFKRDAVRLVVEEKYSFASVAHTQPHLRALASGAEETRPNSSRKSSTRDTSETTEF